MRFETLVGEWSVLCARLDRTRVLARWSRDEPALAAMSCLNDLVAATDKTQDRRSADDVIGALIRIAAINGGDDSDAATVVLHLMRNGLCRLAGRLHHRGPEVLALVVGEAACVIRSFPWQRINRGCAARILLDVKHNLWYGELAPLDDATNPAAALLVDPADLTRRRGRAAPGHSRRSNSSTCCCGPPDPERSRCRTPSCSSTATTAAPTEWAAAPWARPQGSPNAPSAGAANGRSPRWPRSRRSTCNTWPESPPGRRARADPHHLEPAADDTTSPGPRGPRGQCRRDRPPSRARGRPLPGDTARCGVHQIHRKSVAALVADFALPASVGRVTRTPAADKFTSNPRTPRWPPCSSQYHRPAGT